MNQERHGNCWVMRGVIFALFALCLLLFRALLPAGRYSDSTLGNYCCLFPLLCMFLWMYRLISVVIFSWTGNGQEWTWCCSRMDIRVCVLVSACSSSWYVLYLFVRFSYGLLSTCVTTGWIFEITLSVNSINQSILSDKQYFRGIDTAYTKRYFGWSILLLLSNTQYFRWSILLLLSDTQYIWGVDTAYTKRCAVFTLVDTAFIKQYAVFPGQQYCLY